MKRSTFFALILGIIGGVFFSLGMCMALLPEWGMRQQGIVSGVVGLAVFLIDWIAWRKMTGKAPIRISPKTLATVFVGVFGALLLGIGMCLSMVFAKMIVGILIGILGIVILLLLIPMTKGLHN